MVRPSFPKAPLVTAWTCVDTRKQSSGNNQVSLHGLLLGKSGYTLAPQQNNPMACPGRRRNFILRNDKIFSQALSCFINACLIWGKRKPAEASMVVLYAVNWQCFGTKNNFYTRVLTASLSHFPSPAIVCARERREPRNSSTFTIGRAETRRL